MSKYINLAALAASRDPSRTQGQRDFAVKTCLCKQPYGHIETAKGLAKRIKRDRGHNIGIYSCQFCGQYHLTSRMGGEGLIWCTR